MTSPSSLSKPSDAAKSVNAVKKACLIVKQGEIREDTEGRTLHVQPSYDPGAVPDIEAWFDVWPVGNDIGDGFDA